MSRPLAAAISSTASAKVSARGPDSSYTWLACPSLVSTAAATSAMSSASRNGSPTSPAGRATSPSRTGPRRKPSLKFWLNQLHRNTVHVTPALAHVLAKTFSPLLEAGRRGECCGRGGDGCHRQAAA